VNVKVHFDGSGKNNSSVLTVGGFFAYDSVCEQIEIDWNAALTDEGYCEPDGSPGVFHLADFGSPHCRYGTGKWDIKTKRVPFLKRLAGVINRPDNHIVSMSIENSQYREFLKETPNPFLYGPDYFSGCAIMAFTFVEVQLELAKVIKQPVLYVFEKGDRQHELNHSFMEYDGNHPDFEDRSILFGPKRLPLLQAADLVAGKVQEILVRAQGALGFLDNGMKLTPVNRFERYYSYDRTSEAIMKGSALHNCYVANKQHFVDADVRTIETIRKNPALMERRLHRDLLISAGRN
jgi:hypothetical protein